MLAHDRELADRVKRLLDDVETLHTASGIGFTEADTDRVARNVDHLAATPWTTVDFRETSAETAKKALLEQWDAPVLVTVVKPDAAPRPLLQLLRAFVDKSSRVDLGDFEPRARTENQSVIVVVDGANELADMSPELRRVPYWDLVDR